MIDDSTELGVFPRLSHLHTVNLTYFYIHLTLGNHLNCTTQ